MQARILVFIEAPRLLVVRVLAANAGSDDAGGARADAVAEIKS